MDNITCECSGLILRIYTYIMYCFGCFLTFFFSIKYLSEWLYCWKACDIHVSLRFTACMLLPFYLCPAHTDCILSPCVTHTGAFNLWLASQCRTLWETIWWRHSNASSKSRDPIVLFICLSVFPSTFLFLYVIFLHACFSAAHWFICGKQKRRNCLAFYFVFVFCFAFFCKV